MYRRLTTTSPGRGFQGVPVTIFSVLSFKRLPSTFRRTDRAKTAPVSNPMMCSSLRSDFTSQIAVRQRSSSFVRSAVLGSLYQIASPNIAMPAVYSRPWSLEYPVLPSALTAYRLKIHPRCLTNHGNSGDSVVISIFAFLFSRCENISPIQRLPCSYSQRDSLMVRNTLVDIR